VAVVLKRTIPTERPPLVGEISANLLQVEGVAWSEQQIHLFHDKKIPTAVNLGFLDRSRYSLKEVALILSSRGWVDPIPTPYLSENLVGPEIEPGISGSAARNFYH
jgi:hypothetical protein